MKNRLIVTVSKNYHINIKPLIQNVNKKIILIDFSIEKIIKFNKDSPH
jgi:hypothetical protein